MIPPEPATDVSQVVTDEFADEFAVIQPLPRLHPFRDRQPPFCGEPSSALFLGR
jgi:hypothetical protein